MTQKSWPWSTVAAVGDGASELGESDSREFLALYFKVQDPTDEGVSKGVLNELAVSGASSPLSVASGSAICYGLYVSNAVENLTVATPSLGTTGGRVVLQTNWAGTGGASLEARTRLAVKLNSDGVAAIPAVTQTVGVTWEITLATFTITTGGVIALTDARTFRKSTAMVGTDEIEDLAVTAGKLAAAVSNQLVTNGDSHDHVGGDGSPIPAGGLANGAVDTTARLADDIVTDAKAGDRVIQMSRRQGGNSGQWDSPGTTTYTPADVLQQVGTLNLVFSSSSSATVTVTFPLSFVGTPLVLAVASVNSPPILISIGVITSTQVTLQGDTLDGSSISDTVVISWFALGATS